MAAMLATPQTWPRRRASMPGRTAPMKLMVPPTLTSMTSAAVAASSGHEVRWMPAARDGDVARPQAALERGDGPPHGRLVGGVAGHRVGRAPGGADRRHDVGQGGLPPGDDAQPRSGGCSGPADLPTDAAGAPRDEDRFATPEGFRNHVAESRRRWTVSGPSDGVFRPHATGSSPAAASALRSRSPHACQRKPLAWIHTRQSRSVIRRIRRCSA